MSMKRVGILLLLAALSASAQMRGSSSQRGPVQMSGAGRGFAPQAPRGTVPNWHNGGWQGGAGWNNGGVRVGNWTFRTVPAQRGCPGFNCVSYPYYPSYYPIVSYPYYPSYGYSVYDMQAAQAAQPQQPQYVYADNGASQTNAYDAGFAAGLQTAGNTAARYGDHYLDARENAPPPAPAAQSSVSVIQGQTGGAAATRSYTSSAPATISPATVLVFKDGHTAEIHNYAIIGTTLWNLSESSARKIPLGDLDLDATVKANDDRGMSFKVPAVHN
jgi:hypothetical protein